MYSKKLALPKGVLVTAVSMASLNPIQAAFGAETAALEEVVVTAQRREQKLNEVPLAIQSVSGEYLRDTGFTDLRDLTTYIPSFRADNPGNPAAVTYAIRGVGQRDVNPVGEGNVALFIDGAYVAYLSTVGQPIFDIERIEVLKGPQGTLFGRNATGGLIHVISKKPTEETEGYITVEASSDSGQRVEGVISGALSDTTTARLSLSYDKSDGWLENTTGPDLLAKENRNLRFQVNFAPNDDFNLLLSARVWDSAKVPGIGLAPQPYILDANGEPQRPPDSQSYIDFCSSIGIPGAPADAWKGGSCFAAQPDPYKGTYGTASEYDQKYYAFTATAEWVLSNGWTLTSISDYQHMEMDYSANITATTDPLFQYDIYTDPQKQFSQELRLSGENEKLNWQTGLYYLDLHNEGNTDIDLTGIIGLPFLSEYILKAESYAAFAQADIFLSEDLTLTVGGRVMHDEKDMNRKPNDFLSMIFPPFIMAAGGLQEVDKDDNWSGKVVFSYTPNEDWMLYAGINRGVKGGGYNTGGVETYLVSEAYYKPETLVSYEAGAKGTLMDGALSLDAAIYHYDYKDYQAFAQPAGSAIRTINVDATVDGFDLMLAYAVTSNLTISTGMTFLDAQQKDVPLPGGGFEDFMMPSAPDFSANAQIRYATELAGDDKLSIQLNATYSDERSIAAVDYESMHLDEYHRFDLRVTYDFPGERLSLTGFVNNLTDEYILVNRVDFTGLSGNAVDTLERPRWGGVSLTYRY